MLEFSKESPDYLQYYKDSKPPNFPEILSVRVPILTASVLKYPTDYKSIWKLSIRSGQILGDVRKRGVVSCGYYRYDMPSSEIHMIDEATDLINVCRRYKYAAVNTSTMNQTLYSILVKNGISVYTTHSSEMQPSNGKVGVWGNGKLKSFSWGLYKQDPPKLTGDTPVCPSPILAQNRKAIFFNYVYIPAVPDPLLKYLPCINAASGQCIATNMRVEGVAIPDLMTRFCRGQMFRNMFPYTRLTFGNQDVMRTWFTSSWTFPKRRERSVTDIFSGAVEEAIPYDEKYDDFIVYGQIKAADAFPTPKQKNKQDFMLSLGKFSDDELKYFYMNAFNGVCDLKNPEINAIFADMALDDFVTIIQTELMDREVERKKRNPLPPEPDFSIPDTGLNFADMDKPVATTSEQPPPAAFKNPFDGPCEEIPLIPDTVKKQD